MNDFKKLEIHFSSKIKPNAKTVRSKNKKPHPFQETV
jgi:hypothetical protein